MSYSTILVENDGGIVRLTLNRPEDRNAMTSEMGEEIRDAVDAINADKTSRVVVIRGAGKSFSAGGNLTSLMEEAEGSGPGIGGGRSFYSLFLSIRDLEMPSIAAINGHAIGAGFCFTLGADLRIVHERAKLGMTFVKLGIHPGMAASWNLPRLIGPAAAADLLYSGRIIDGAEALQLGVASRCAGDDFDDVVDEVAQSIASSAPVAVRSLKETLRGTWDRTIEEAIGREADAQAMTFTTADAKEGLTAIQEKRAPDFKGE